MRFTRSRGSVLRYAILHAQLAAASLARSVGERVAIASESNDRQTGMFVSLLPPARHDRQLALVLIVVSLAVFVALAPFARLRLGVETGFIPAYRGALFIIDLVTAAILFSQFVIVRTPALLLLASAYLFSTLITVPFTLSFYGVFAPGAPPTAAPEMRAWLYVYWHAGFPLLVMAYALAKRRDRPLVAPRAAVLGSIAAVATAVAVLAILTAVDTPTCRSSRERPLYPFGRSCRSCVGQRPGFCSRLWSRPHSALDLWLIVVLTAWLLDVATNTVLVSGRYDLGFYVGRAYGLLAMSYVLIMLLVETRGLYARRAGELVSERQSAEAALARSEENYRYLFVNSPLPRWVYSISTEKFLEVNDAAIARYGYSRDEFLSMTIEDITPPDDVERLRKWHGRPAAERALATDSQHPPKSGRRLDVELFLRDIEYGGQPARNVVVIDIGAQGGRAPGRRIFETSQTSFWSPTATARSSR